MLESSCLQKDLESVMALIREELIASSWEPQPAQADLWDFSVLIPRREVPPVDQRILMKQYMWLPKIPRP